MQYFATNGHRAAVSSDILLVEPALFPVGDILCHSYNKIHEVKDDRVEALQWNLSEVFPTAFSWQIRIHFTEAFRIFLQSGKDSPCFGIKENGLFFMGCNSCVTFKDTNGILPQERITFQSDYFNAIVSELKETGLPAIEIAGNGKEEVVRFSLFGDDRVYHYLMPVIHVQ